MKNALLLIMVLALCEATRAQTISIDSICWVTVNNSSNNLITGSPQQPSASLQAILNKHKVFSFEKALPAAINPDLQKVYEIICDCDIDNLITDLQASFPMEMTNYKKFEYKNVSTYDPPDWLWTEYKQGNSTNLWHLAKIQADLAWDITKGDPNLKIASIDTDFDITHPDLDGKIDPPYDPFDLTSYPANPVATMNSHGTAAVSMIAAETAEQGQTPNGIMASVGFKSRVMCYQAWVGNYLQRAHHASLVMGARIITSSAGGWSECPDPSGYEQKIVKEILDNGTTIIMPAGNGVNKPFESNYCLSVDPNYQTPFFPLHPYYDSRIIIVTGSDKNDNFHYIHPASGDDRTHTYSPYVDLCAPGHEVLLAMPRQGNFLNNPYYWDGQGTSFATPLVAGVAALVLSVNNCLSPAEVESILKSTTDPIVDAANYSGLIGTGRVNAYKAVQMAQTWGTGNFVVSNSEDITFNLMRSYQNVTVKSGGVLRITNTELIMGNNGRITIEPGGKLYITNSIIRAKELRTWCPTSLYKWQGIVVEGNKNLDQYPASNQGYVYVLNSTIQDAVNAISTTSLDAAGNINWPKAGGGIVIVNGSKFINNNRHVEFLAYQRPNQVNNVSSFTNCYFELSGSTFVGSYSPGSSNTYGTLFGRTMITAWGVKGVRFNGCTFKNINGSANANLQGYDRGTGMLIYDASVIVQDQMNNINCNTIKRGSFEDLSKGVFAFHSPSVTIGSTIKKQDFISCDKGIWLKNGLATSIYKNTFDLNVPTNYYNRVQSINDPYYRTGILGVLSVGAAGFKIEENIFALANKINNQVVVGLIVDNSDNNGGGGTFRINTLNGTNIGSQTQFNNAYVDFTCNQYNANSVAVEMNPVSFNVSKTPDFGKCGTLNTQFDYSNVFTSNSFDVRHFPSNIKEYLAKTGAPNRPVQSRTLRTNVNTSCNTVFFKSCSLTNQFQDPCNQSFPANLGDAKLKYAQMKLGKSEMQNKLDNGGSVELLSTLQQGTAISAEYIYDMLLSLSPNLSDQALIYTLQYCTHLSEQEMVAILIANSSLAPEVLEVVDNYGFSEEAMMQIVDAQWNVPSGRTISTYELAYFTKEVINARNEVIWLCNTNALIDTVHNYTDSIIDFLITESDIDAQKQLAATYFIAGDFGNVQNTINGIYANDDDLETQSFKQYYQLLLNVNNEGRNIFLLNNTELDVLAELTAHSTAAGESAKGLLSLIQDQHFDGYIERSTGNHEQASIISSIQQVEEQQLARINVFPNPANTHVDVNYMLRVFSNDITVKLLNVTGKEISSQKSKNIQATLSFDVSDLSPGFYYIQLIGNGKVLGVEKVVIQR